MINKIEKADSVIGLNLSVNELDSYLSIPDPGIKTSLLYNNYLYVIIGEIPGAEEGNFPRGYRINMEGLYAEPFNLSLNSNSSTEFTNVGVANMLDNPFSNSGYFYSNGTDDFLVTITQTTTAYNGYAFVRIGLTQNTFGSTLIKKIPGISSDVEISDVVKIDNYLVFMSKQKVVNSTYSNFHTLNIATEELTTTAITTPLTGGQTFIGYSNEIYIFGGTEIDADSGESVSFNRKFYKVDMIAQGTLIEVILTGSTAGVLPAGLSYTPAAQDANRVYLTAGAPYNAIYMVNLDSLISSRIALEETGIDPKLAFIYNKFVYSLNTNTMRLISTPAPGESYAVEASTIQFIITDPAMLSEHPYFEYTFTKKDSLIQTNNTKVIELAYSN